MYAGCILWLSITTTVASVTYHWVCDTNDCNGDPEFSSTIVISDSAYTIGYFAGINNNVVSWDITSGIGNGFSLNLSDLISGPPGSTINDDDNLRIMLSADKLEIILLEDVSSGANITFENPLEGRADFFEAMDYSVGALRDGSEENTYSDIIIRGRFVKTTPESGSLLPSNTHSSTYHLPDTSTTDRHISGD